MSLTKTYTKNPCSLDSITNNIQHDSSITIALDLVNTSLFGDQLTIAFLSDMADWTEVDTVVANNNGQPLPQNTSQLVSVNSAPAFASKTITVNNVTKSLYKRFTGINQALSVGANTFTWTQANYPWVKFLGIEVINAEVGDTCDLYVLDTATGTYSGHANYPLNQFAYGANVSPTYYKHVSEYDADVYQGLQIKFVYTSISAKTIYINFDMNEVK